MSVSSITVSFAFGMMAMWNFMRTAYAYPDLSRWYYAGDLAVAVVFLGFAIVLSRKASA